MSDQDKMRGPEFDLKTHFRCDMCAEVFKKNRPEEEVLKEKERLFPGIDREDCYLVCDECFKTLGLSDE